MISGEGALSQFAVSAPTFGRVKNRTGRLNSPTRRDWIRRTISSFYSKSDRAVSVAYPAIKHLFDVWLCRLGFGSASVGTREVRALDFRDRPRSEATQRRNLRGLRLCLLRSATIARSRTATTVNHSLVLRVDRGRLLAEKIEGQDLFVDSLAGRTSTLEPSGFLRHVHSTIGACCARPDVKPSMNSVQESERSFHRNTVGN